MYVPILTSLQLLLQKPDVLEYCVRYVSITCEKINDLREEKKIERKSYHTDSKKAFYKRRKMFERERFHTNRKNNNI